MPHSSRVVIGVLAVAALAVFASMNSYQISAQDAEQFPDRYGVVAAEGRFAPALQLLPVNAVIGYISDLPLSETAGSTAFVAAQYAMAPRSLVLASAQRTQWAVGNFARPADFATIGVQAGFTMVRDFGSGVVVYRRTTPW